MRGGATRSSARSLVGAAARRETTARARATKRRERPLLRIGLPATRQEARPASAATGARTRPSTASLSTARSSRVPAEVGVTTRKRTAEVAATKARGTSAAPSV